MELTLHTSVSLGSVTDMKAQLEEHRALRETRALLCRLVDPERASDEPDWARADARRLLRKLLAPNDVVSVLEALAQVSRAA